MIDYGFIITRQVNSEKTNRYWNQSVKLIRTYYPLRQIVIIDDYSNPDFVKADYEYQNLQVVQSEYKGRGELLPYVYYLRYKWFPNAVIVHDSFFIHKHIPFEFFNVPVMPLWHHPYDQEHLHNLNRIARGLKNTRNVLTKLNSKKDQITILGIPKYSSQFNLCFGAQTFINLGFLEKLENKYNITNLTNYITCRKDRCGLERIIGLLFDEEYPQIKKYKSLFGEIDGHYKAFGYSFDEYVAQFKRGKVIGAAVKVWTGR